MLLICAGGAACDSNGGSGSGSGSEDVLSGTKVLSRPSGYSFSDAVGEFSEHYYNLYAAKILEYLYKGYENADFTAAVRDPGAQEGYVALEGENTYGKFSDEKDKYYLFDSLRYTINKVESLYDTTGAFSNQVVYLDLSDAWNWTIKDEASYSVGSATHNDDVFFKTILGSTNYKKEGTTATATFGTQWLNFYDTQFGLSQSEFSTVKYPDFQDSYIGGKVSKTSMVISDIVNYYKSPYYDTEIEELAASTAKNFFQDALEYAIHMFVLGYDYHTYNEEGSVTGINETHAPYFDFNITHTNGYVSAMTVAAVPGLGNNVSVVDALKFAKNKYKEIGGYVGVTEKNLDQITRFILEKVIGEKSSDVVTVIRESYKSDGNNGKIPMTAQTPLVFNRNYEALVNNIVRYTCKEAPIGATLVDGKIERLSLSNAFPASMITEYLGNYFFGNYDTIVDGVHVNDDTELFKNIEAAEYQSLVIYPGKELVGKTLGDLWLDFEYYENNNPAKTMLDELYINVGFRYYDHKTGKIIDKQGEEPLKITWGKNGTLKDEHGEDISDQTMFLIGEGEDGPYQVKLEEGSVEFRTFKNPAVLNPFANGTIIDPTVFKASKYLSGNDNARSYYKLNNSKTAGQYGTLNEVMFEGECSFIEVYFDIVKDPSKDNVSYDFKVCFRTVTEHEDPNAIPDIDDDDFDDEDF